MIGPITEQTNDLANKLISSDYFTLILRCNNCLRFKSKKHCLTWIAGTESTCIFWTVVMILFTLAVLICLLVCVNWRIKSCRELQKSENMYKC